VLKLSNEEKWLTWLYANSSPGGSVPFLTLEIFRRSALSGHDMEREFGRPVGMLHRWSNGRSWKYFLREDVEAVGRVFLERIIEDPEFLELHYTEAERRVNVLRQSSMRFAQIDFSGANEVGFRGAYSIVANNYWSLGFYGVMPILFGGFILEPEINKYLLSLGLDSEKFEDVLATFTKPRVPTPLHHWETSLDELVFDIKASPTLRTTFDGSPSEILRGIEGSEFYNKLEEHIKEFQWVFYKWTGPIRDTEFFVSEIKRRLTTKTSQAESDLDAILAKEERLISELGIDETHRRYLGSLRTLVEMKNLKAEGMSYGAYCLHPFRTELCARYGIRPEDTRYLLEEDIHRLLVKGDLDLEKHRARKDEFLWVVENCRERMYVGSEVEDIRAREEPKHETNFLGTVAYPGEAVGTARVVVDYETYNGLFSKGDILVAPRTTDSYFPLFPLAGAIITSEGGLTSHAATIAREYKIPTIIGVTGIHTRLPDNAILNVCADPSNLEGGSIDRIVTGPIRKHTTRKFPEEQRRTRINRQPMDRVGGPEIVNFTDVMYGEPNRSLLGTKATNQILCCRMLNVPDGFVVTTVLYRKFLEESSLMSKIRELPDRLERIGTDPRDIRRLSAEYRHAILDTDVHGLFDPVFHAYKELGSPSTATRSSALYEDMVRREGEQGRSFAGIFDTFTNLRDRREIVSGIKRCWASLFSPRALSYTITTGLDPSSNQMAVLIQEMLNGVSSGVMYTDVDGHILIEACEGLCEPLVAGEITPTTYVLDQDSLYVAHVVPSNQSFASYINADGVLDRRDPSRPKVLSPKELFELGKIASKIRNYFGPRQDIEFTIAGNIIHVTQNRDITTEVYLPAGVAR